MRLAALLNKLFAFFNLRVTRASSWKALQERYQNLNVLASSSEARQRIGRLARLLIPVKAVGHLKARLGDPHDGGYVCLDDLEDIKMAFSFGIADNVTWDTALADRGMPVYQLDYSVNGPPHMHPKFHFQKARVVPALTRPSADEESISSLLSRHAERRIASIILKMDVEHDEWEILDSTEEDDLRVFSQIICEFHGFDRVINIEWYKRALGVLTRLDRSFAVVHVHANNCRPLLAIGNAPFPEVLEVTYANRARYRFEPTSEIFPTPLDAPNDCSKPDIPLNFSLFE